MAPKSYLLLLVGGCAATFAAVFAVAGSPAADAVGGKVQSVASAAAEAATYYPGCNAVRAAGKAPLYRGQPGYREDMDGDSDGIACEPYSGANSGSDGGGGYHRWGGRRRR